MRYEMVKVTRDTNTVHNRAVPTWEIPMLEWVFDEGNVVRSGEFVTPVRGKLINREYPSAAEELDRLTKVYGSDPKSGVPHAFSVYGNARAGIRTLQKMIDDAKAADKEAIAADELLN